MINDNPIKRLCPGCRTSKGHKWQKLYAADGVVIHLLKDVYITYCSNLERYFLLDDLPAGIAMNIGMQAEKKVMVDN